MSDTNPIENSININPDWLTINEAVGFLKQINNLKIGKSDIYRHALQGKIHLSIYFQSPIILRRIKSKNQKLKLITLNSCLIKKLCMLDKNSFSRERNFTFSTEGEYFSPTHNIIDTTLQGYEYIFVQRLLARALKLPPPRIGTYKNNYGITVSLHGKPYQIFEKITWQERIENQINRLPHDLAKLTNKKIFLYNLKDKSCKEYFPLHELPKDACIVIRSTEIKKLITAYANNQTSSTSPTRISTPLSRLFWLACKHNETISPLIKQPYKLLSIFEQWASADGITDRLSGDTLKTALKRGSPSSF